MGTPTARPEAELDDKDRAILRILQQDNKTPQRLIAEQVNLSAPAVQRRIARLESAGVIRKNIAVVEPAALGLGTSVMVEVHSASDRAVVLDGLKQQFRDAPEVQQCYHVGGNGGFIVIVHVPDIAAFDALARRLFSENELVYSFRSLVVLDPVKVSLAIEV
ncbi:Lrp/AsnC family transcriptional regulator [Donghicola sp. C2-DW-16]|uniref:Lrp/AsnC family transcriptional regulator n=1 Tax=Donghicola mangrovi TaxID=2729614 RepID=A0ABX2PGE6_9RHOB|nr:Lrp/AsnC family transcriptional regulator [Donghicola mangrovi]NVO28087.1 Lrp/AsnC family transcriptional regulator [Donghicola mangrovi]